jgi:tripartite-type tricarboxylate transporter receptor subunit TctC
VAAVNTPDVQKTLDIEGAVVVSGTPEEFGTFMATESKRWADLIAETGLTTD